MKSGNYWKEHEEGLCGTRECAVSTTKRLLGEDIGMSGGRTERDYLVENQSGKTNAKEFSVLSVNAAFMHG
ncbi:MAG: hypothetical protein ABID54_10000 [Pseudomonadota bacterium]